MIGKTALKAVQELWEEGTPASEIKEIVAQYFPVPRHIFARPDAEVCGFLLRHDLILFPQSDQGPFQSTLILKVFALQQSLTIKIPVTYGNPIGSLALCAAAVHYSLVSSLQSPHNGQGGTSIRTMEGGDKHKLGSPAVAAIWLQLLRLAHTK